MYVYIIKAGYAFSTGLTHKPIQFIQAYRNGEVEGTQPFVCNMGEYIYIRDYPHRSAGKLERLVSKLDQRTLAYYAKQSPATLTTWFNTAAELPPPHDFERDLINSDMLYTLHRFNRGLYLVK